MKDNLILVGLDIGTTKITTVIGEVAADGSVDIIGEGTVPSEGIKRGAVVNLERTTSAIRNSVAAAERVSGVKVTQAYVSVAGNHTRAMTSHGLAAIRRSQEIGVADVERSIENARAVPLDPNFEVIHAIPQEYVVDGQEGIKSPVGMHGIRLEVDVHIVAGSAAPLANLRRCVQEAGVQVRGLVLESLASGTSVLDFSERDQTVVVIDMGGGTTDVGVFKRGNLSHSACIPIGGDHVTTDLAQILKIPLEEAENVKRKYGAALPELADPDLMLEITNASGATHAISAFDLSRIIKPRIAEIYGMVRDEIDAALGPVELIASGVVLTGGGSLLRGVSELARERFRLPVRVGRPRGFGGLTDIVAGPVHAAAVGLVLYAAEQYAHQHVPALVGSQAAVPAGQSGGQQARPMPVDGGDLTPPLVDEPPSAEPKPAKPPKPAKTGNEPSVLDKVRNFFKDWI